MKKTVDLNLKISNIWIDNNYIYEEFNSIHDLEYFLLGFCYGSEL